MKKADNFNAKQWLVENKITFQSRLNEFLDYDKVQQLGKKAVEDYIIKNNLGSIDNIKSSGGGVSRDKASAVFYSKSPTGEITNYTVRYDANYNLVDIETRALKFTDTIFKPTKVKGVKVSVDDNDVTFSGKSGEYDSEIEDNGTIYLEVFYADMEEDEEEIDNDNWKDILGPNHVFVKIANTIPTEVQTEGDAVGIRFKASDIIK